MRHADDSYKEGIRNRNKGKKKKKQNREEQLSFSIPFASFDGQHSRTRPRVLPFVSTAHQQRRRRVSYATKPTHTSIDSSSTTTRHSQPASSSSYHNWARPPSISFHLRNPNRSIHHNYLHQIPFVFSTSIVHFPHQHNSPSLSFHINT